MNIFEPRKHFKENYEKYKNNAAKTVDYFTCCEQNLKL